MGQNRKIYGYLCKNELKNFIYCCSHCKLQFSSGIELESHTFDHDIKDECLFGAKKSLNDDEFDGSEVILSAHVTNCDKEDNANTKTEVECVNNDFLEIQYSNSSEEIEPKYDPIYINPSTCEHNEQSLPYEDEDENRPLHSPSIKDQVPQLTCELCGKVVRNLKKHMRMHEDGHLYQYTTLCPAEDSHTGSAKGSHLNVHRQQYSYVVSSRKALNVQVQKNNQHDENDAKSEVMHDENGTNEQISSKDKQKAFECYICSARFQKNSNLMRHMEIHSVNRPSATVCTICDKTVLDIKIHMRTHTGEKPYKCKLCPAAFRNSVSMHDHQRRHGDSKEQLVCKFCNVMVFSSRDLTRHIAKCNKIDAKIDLTQFEAYKLRKVTSLEEIPKPGSRLRACHLCSAKVKNLKIHLRSHSRERPFQCSLCAKKFTQTGHRNKHFRTCHNEATNQSSSSIQCRLQNFGCEICNKNFDSIIDLDDHMRLHISNERMCQICEKILAPGCITSHMRTHTGSKHYNYKCPICPTSFARKDHLENHVGAHTGIKPYKCSYCEDDAAFFSSAAFKKHMRELHPDIDLSELKRSDHFEKIVCTVCGKEINQKNIELHMRTHTGERPHKCGICPSAFAQKSNLQNHIRRHTGQKPYTCIPCQKSFHSACALNSHKRRHNTDKTFKCEMCENAFRTKRSLNNHFNVHHVGERSHCCHICNKKFAWSSGLRNHISQHVGSIYQCKYCEIRFAQKAEQRDHERSEHNAP